MTALFPSREDAELNARALATLEKDKRNEADCLMDGAWTGHPDQNEIAVAQFPAPNQIHRRPVRHTPEFVSELFDEELNRILRELSAEAPPEAIEKYRAARRVSEEMIARGEFDPI
jgi:malate synthase